MQISTLTHTHNHASIPPLSFLQAGLLPNQQRQITEVQSSVKQCINEAINQSTKQSTKQSINQSINHHCRKLAKVGKWIQR